MIAVMKSVRGVVSVIIPAARPKLAEKAKASVLRQKVSGVVAEVVMVKALGMTPGKARNLGARRARGEWLIFLDDDCQARPGWLRENLRFLTGEETGAVGGMVEGKSGKYFARCVDYANFTFAQTSRRREMPICAASLGVKRTVFEAVGGFREDTWVGEDTDFCFRLQEKGGKTIYEPRIKVWHEHGRETMRDLLAYQFRNGRLKGLTIEMRYPAGVWFRFLKMVAHPGVYWLLILPFAVTATLAAGIVGTKDRPWLAVYLPGVFLGKLACQLGIYTWLIKKP